MKIKLSQYTPRKAEETFITPKVSILTRKVTQENQTEIYLNSDVLLVMRKDIIPKIVLETKMALTRRRETREYIMLMLQKMMNLPQRESSKKVMMLQVMKNMS